MKIGIFDSGYGGLTILQSIRQQLPEYDYLYLGDNARAPYGEHSFDVIYHDTLQAVRYLIGQNCALIILACNTASARALRTIQQRDLPALRHNEIPNVLGVIRPTVEQLPLLTRTRHIGVLATPATVASESYALETHKLAPDIVVTQHACPMWVPLIESGEYLQPGAEVYVRKYLREILERDPLIDTLVLGCTHYPLLRPQIETCLQQSLSVAVTGDSPACDSSICDSPTQLNILSQGQLVASSLQDYLRRHTAIADALSTGGTCIYQTTENAERFAQSASIFLSSPIQADHVDF